MTGEVRERHVEERDVELVVDGDPLDDHDGRDRGLEQREDDLPEDAAGARRPRGCAASSRALGIAADELQEDVDRDDVRAHEQHDRRPPRVVEPQVVHHLEGRHLRGHRRARGSRAGRARHEALPRNSNRSIAYAVIAADHDRARSTRTTRITAVFTKPRAIRPSGERGRVVGQVQRAAGASKRTRSSGDSRADLSDAMTITTSGSSVTSAREDQRTRTSTGRAGGERSFMSGSPSRPGPAALDPGDQQDDEQQHDRHAPRRGPTLRNWKAVLDGLDDEGLGAVGAAGHDERDLEDREAAGDREDEATG